MLTILFNVRSYSLTQSGFDIMASLLPKPSES